MELAAVAAYKAAEVVSKLIQAGCEVNVCMTPQAERFISALTFSALTGRPTQTQEQRSQDSLTKHILTFIPQQKSIFSCLFRQPQIQLDRLHTA